MAGMPLIFTVHVMRKVLLSLLFRLKVPIYLVALLLCLGDHMMKNIKLEFQTKKASFTR